MKISPALVGLVAVAFAGLGAGVASVLVLVNLFAEDDDPHSFTETIELGSASDDLAQAVQELQGFMEDFECAGEWDGEERIGSVGCVVGLGGFDCTLDAGVASWRSVSCSSGEPLPEEFASCAAARPSRSSPRNIVACGGPSGNVVCRMDRPMLVVPARFEIACQRAWE